MSIISDIVDSAKGVKYGNRAQRRGSKKYGSAPSFPGMRSPKKVRRTIPNTDLTPHKPGFKVEKQKPKPAALCKECLLEPRINGSSRGAKCTAAYRAKQKKS